MENNTKKTKVIFNREVVDMFSNLSKYSYAHDADKKYESFTFNCHCSYYGFKTFLDFPVDSITK